MGRGSAPWIGRCAIKGVRPEVLEFVEETKRYVDEELMPLEDEIERTDYLPPEVIADVAKRGYFGMTIPKKYGGLGFKLVETCLVLEQIHKAPLAIGYVVDLNNGIGSLAILHGGTEEQKREYRRDWHGERSSGSLRRANPGWVPADRVLRRVPSAGMAIEC